jgi:hypothetical protein
VVCNATLWGVDAMGKTRNRYTRKRCDTPLMLSRSPHLPTNTMRELSTWRSGSRPETDNPSLHHIEERDFETPETVFQVGVAPRRIDILTTIDAVDFDTAWSERDEVEIAGLRVPVISRHHLLQNKKATGRARDQADALWLEGEK